MLACKLKRKWAVLVALFMIMAIAPGFLWSANMFYTDIIETFNATRSEASLVWSCMSGSVGLMGIPNGLLVHRLGSRRSGMVGGTFATLAFALSYFATSTIYLTVSIGIGVGSMISILCIVTQVEIGVHFKGKSRVFAMAFVMFAIGTAGLCWPLLLTILIDMYGLQGTLLVFGGVMFHCVAFSALIKPPSQRHTIIVEQHMEIISVNYQSNVSNKDKETNTTEDTDIHLSVVKGEREIFTLDNQEAGVKNISTRNQHKLEEVDIEHGKTKHPCVNRDIPNATQKENRNMRSDICFLLTNVPFLVESFAIACSIGSASAIVAIIMDHVVTIHFQRTDGVFTILFVNAANAASRILIALIKQIPKMSILAIPVIITAISGLALLAVPFARAYIYVVILLCLGVGLCIGGLYVLLPLTIMRLVELRILPVAIGIAQTFCGISTVTLGPIIGLIKDVYGTYNLAFYLSGGMLLFNCAILVVPLIMVKYKKSCY